MLFAGDNRNDLRRRYYDAWKRHQERLPLDPLDAAIADVIALHPEYHRLFETADALHEAFTVERGQTNPFLHMGLHLGLREQLATKRPAGIDAVHARLARKRGLHEAEHAMIEVLATALWEAQRAGGAPDEALYLERLQRL
jgi:hypothetical protein